MKRKDDGTAPFSPIRERGVFATKDNKISAYIAFRILRKIRDELGFEAMMEYFDYFCRTVEKRHSGISETVTMALRRLDVEKVYRKATR